MKQFALIASLFLSVFAFAGDDATPPAPYTDLSSESFDAFVGENEITVVDFWAPWCGPCRVMAPTFEASAKELAGKAKYAKVNVDDNAAIASRFEIRAIPSIIILKNGEPVDTILGVVPQEELSSRVKAQL